MAAKTTENELRIIKNLVHAELENNPATRKDDMLLVTIILRKMGIDTSQSFEDMARGGKLRHWSSITRARRKIQEQHPELKDTTTVGKRAEQEVVYRNFAHNAI